MTRGSPGASSVRPFRARFAGFALLVAGVSLGACAAPRVSPVSEPAGALRPAGRLGRAALRDDGDRPSLAAAVRQSLVWLEREPPERVFVAGPRTVTAREQARGLERLLEILARTEGPDALAAAVVDEFEALESVGGQDGGVLVTGYYEPVVDAAPAPSDQYRVPVLGRPPDLVEVSLEAFDPRWRGERVAGRVEGRRLVPYWRRAEIDAGRLDGRGLELAWARDPVDVFFMEIQGSGVLRFPDGAEMRVGYAGSNGRPYRANGRLLVDEGRFDRAAMSMQAIRGWLRDHPEERTRVLQANESYVFFRPLDGPPVGHIGVPLTPVRSIATDARLFPPGALAFLRTERPVRQADGSLRWEPMARFVLNQDTGGAIRGPGRVDLFWGRGDDAEMAAGLMKQPGSLYFLVPRPRP
jgi:membrane-bound lytic murein transglycosylase A